MSSGGIIVGWRTLALLTDVSCEARRSLFAFTGSACVGAEGYKDKSGGLRVCRPPLNISRAYVG